MQSALDILIECCDALGGCLFGPSNGDMILLVETDNMAPPDDIATVARLAAEAETGVTATIDSVQSTASGNCVGLDGHLYYPFPLTREDEAGDSILAAVAVLRSGDGDLQFPGAQMTSIIADELLKAPADPQRATSGLGDCAERARIS